MCAKESVIITASTFSLACNSQSEGLDFALIPNGSLIEVDCNEEPSTAAGEQDVASRKRK